MKVAFVNDSCERHGVQCISAVLKSGGHQVKLFVDPKLFDNENISLNFLSKAFDYKRVIISELKAYKPDLIGISVVTSFYQWACTIAKMIKQEMDVPIIFGGIHPTSVPERVIKNDFVDMVCVGEGEYPMLELANSMEKGSIDYSIKNIWFKRNGQVIQNEVRPLIEDLDSLPMPDKDLYYSASPHFSQSYYIIASRGCPYACSYCCHSYLKKLYTHKGNYFRRRSIDNIINELSSAKEKYNIKLVWFWDEVFPHDIKWLKEFAKKYKEKINLPFLCNLYPNNISSESIGYLKECNCIEVSIGIQTWDENIRSTILHRKMSNKDFERTASIINDKKINLFSDFILGIPGQTEDEIIDFANFFSRKRINHLSFSWLTYFPNTDISMLAKERGYLSSSTYEKINDGIDSKTFNSGGDTANKEQIRLMILFILIKLLPNFISKYFLKNKVYRFFPANIPLRVLSSIDTCLSFSHDKRIVHREELSRYIYFMKKKIFGINIKRNVFIKLQ